MKASNKSPHPGCALVTGASSGIGFEAAAMLAEAGWLHVVVTGRTDQQARETCSALSLRTGRSVFVPLPLDLADLASVRAAAERLVGAPRPDLLLLNAGVLPGADAVISRDGLEVTTAASIGGHHALTVLLLRKGLLGPNARIVIAGSEGARGDAPGMKPVDLVGFANEHFEGDVEKAMIAVMTMKPPARHHWSTTYCTAKVFVALWAIALSKRLPMGMAVHAVSPGNVPSTRAARHQPWYFRWMMEWAGVVGPSLGLATSAAVGARRYLDVASMPVETSGTFFASPRGKLVGVLTAQDRPHLRNAQAAEACWRALTVLTQEGLPEAPRARPTA